MKFRAETLAHRVILKPYIETVTKGGIVLARDERTQAINTDKGAIFMIGPKCEFGLDALKVGDKVFYAKWGAKLLRNEDQPDQAAEDAYYILCNDEDILVGYE